MSGNSPTPLRYRAYIDGLRALAVIPVLFFHADLGMTGGFIGVDIFFVISGYLITALILKDLDVGAFSIVHFWERRVRRILPALAVVVLTVLIVGWFIYLPLDFKELGQSVIAQTLLISNIFFWRTSGYFESAVEIKPLLHTWSLAVEEQFYLFFPFILWALKRYGKVSIPRAILVIGAGSLALSIWASYHYAWANFYLLPTRAWELLIGSYLAAIPVQKSVVRWRDESLSWLGLFAILWAICTYDRETRFPGASAMLPCFGAAAIIWTNNRNLTIVGKLLALKPVVFIGLISYSLYLWHWPVLVFSKYWAIEPLTLPVKLSLLVACLILAILSWKFVESPFRKRQIFDNRKHILLFGGITSAILLVAGMVVFFAHGMPLRLPPEALRYANGALDFPMKNEMSVRDVKAEQFLELGPRDLKQPINLLVWGDSHAMAAMPVFDALCKEHGVRGVAATHSSTAPLIDYQSKESNLKDDCIPFNAAVLAFIRQHQIKQVVLIASWGGYLNHDHSPDQLQAALTHTITTLNASGTQVWIMRDVPKQRWNVPKTLATTTWHRRADPSLLGLSSRDFMREHERQNPIFSSIPSLNQQNHLIDPSPLFIQPNQICKIEINGYPVYNDDNHLTTQGAMMLKPMMEIIFH